MLLQIPGGPELVVVFLIMILLFGIPLLLIVVVGTLYFRAESGSDEEVTERIAGLEAEIAELRADLQEATDGESTDGLSSDDVSTSGNDDR